MIRIPRHSEPTNLTLCSVLLLEDDTDSSDMLRRLLEDRGFTVTAVSNGAEGLKEVMAMDFDVVVCDLLMPRMPGDMFYLAVQKVKPHLSHKFVFLTGHSQNPKLAEFLQLSKGVLVTKPYEVEKLVQTIRVVSRR